MGSPSYTIGGPSVARFEQRSTMVARPFGSEIDFNE